eukprot:scaffold32771_cov73-Phaeocystis_antarctica.AAC.3
MKFTHNNTPLRDIRCVHMTIISGPWAECRAAKQENTGHGWPPERGSGFPGRLPARWRMAR